MIEIRQENKNDYKEVYEVVKTAFESAEHSDGNEHDLVDLLRKSDNFIPELSLVAIDDNKIVPIDVFPFDTKFTYYTGKTNGFLAWPRNHSLRHMLNPLNFSLITPRQTSQDWRHVFISRHITNGNILASAKLLGAGTQFPLYLTPSGEAGRFFEKSDLTQFRPGHLEEDRTTSW